MNQIEEKVPGSEPLKQARLEKFARYRARMFSITQAGLLAGFPAGSGGCSRAEKRANVRERIAWLTRGDEEIEREQRREIERFYWFALRHDPALFWQDGKGENLKALSDMDPESRQLIEGLEFTDKGQPKLKVVSKIAASIELRKLKGHDAPTKIAPTNPEGDGPLKLVIQWKSETSSSTTARAGNSSPSMSDPNASPASLPIDAPAKLSPASTSSSVPRLDVSWSAPGSLISHPFEDKQNP